MFERGREHLLIVVALARQPHTHAAGDGLNALAPQKLVQLRVHANILMRKSKHLRLNASRRGQVSLGEHQSITEAQKDEALQEMTLKLKRSRGATKAEGAVGGGATKKFKNAKAKQK